MLAFGLMTGCAPSHPAQSSFFERLAGEAPLVDPGGCVVYAEEARERLDRRLAMEAAE